MALGMDLKCAPQSHMLKLWPIACDDLLGGWGL